MHRSSFALFVLVGVGLSLGAGCGARRVTDFTVISTKNTMLVAKADKRDRRVTGEDCTMTLVGVPNMKTAIDDAIEKAGPGYDALVDGVVWMDDKILFQCYRVEGTPLKAKKAPPEYDRDGPTGAVRTERGHTFVEREQPRPDPVEKPEPTPVHEQPKTAPQQPAPSSVAAEEAPATEDEANALYDTEEPAGDDSSAVATEAPDGDAPYVR